MLILHVNHKGLIAEIVNSFSFVLAVLTEFYRQRYWLLDVVKYLPIWRKKTIVHNKFSDRLLPCFYFKCKELFQRV